MVAVSSNSVSCNASNRDCSAFCTIQTAQYPMGSAKLGRLPLLVDQ